MRRTGWPSPVPFQTPGDTSEHVVTALPCWVYGVKPELTTTGTIKLRNQATAAGGAALHTCAIGLTQAGMDFGPFGVYFDTGLTVQLSVGTDVSLISWEAAS